MPKDPFSRRNLLKYAAVAGAAAVPIAGASYADSHASAGGRTSGDEFEFEIIRTEAEWREMLTDLEYYILRDGGTETPKTSALWNNEEEGDYHCRGCGLHLYSSDFKVLLDKGWVFFTHSEPNSVLTGIDQVGSTQVIESHCRRCGSHLGHILIVEEQILHCINGTSLVFEKA